MALSIPDDSQGFGVARELRASVERDGTAVPRELYEAFEEYNRDFFNGQLPPATILLTNPSSPRALGDHIPVDDHGIRFRIRISPVCVAKGVLFLRDVLLHEMVHTAQAHLDGDTERGYRGHGPKFAARCNAIGAVLGLPPVAARGARKGQPDCAQWPLCVRPPGYYGAEPQEPKAPTEPRERRPARRGHGGPSRAQALEDAMRTALELLEQGDEASAADALRAALG